jgi:hypothetical protein
MARKVRRRYFPARRGAGRARPDDAERQGQVDAAAHHLASQYTLDELRSVLAERTALLEQADQAGTNNPGPVNLARYHSARADWEVARRAVELASLEAGPKP